MVRTLSGVVVLLALFLSACGGGSDDPTVAPDDTSGGGGNGAAGASTATADDGDGDGETVEAGIAAATVGDETWIFAMTGDPREMCNPDFGGTFFVSMFGTDDDGNEIVFSLNAPGDVVRVEAGSTDIARELWISDPGIYGAFPDAPEGITGTATIDGSQASGSATFYEDRALQATRQSGGAYEAGLREGTFSVSC